MQQLITCIISIMLSFSSYANTPPPKTPFGEKIHKSTLKSKATTGLTMGSLSVQFEKTTLDDVRKLAAVGEISHQGDAAESIYWLCYTNIHPNQVERVWIISHGEMGGSKRSVTNIIAQPLPKGEANSDCPALPKALKPLSLNNLWLNSSENDLSKKLGEPSYESKNWKSYNYQGKVQGNCEGGDDLLSWFAVRVEKSRVTSLHAGQVSSC